MGQVLGPVYVCLWMSMCRCMHACVGLVYRTDVFTRCWHTGHYRSVFSRVCVYVGTCMLMCMCYTELTCIPDVWPSGHYGSGPLPCVCVCICACLLVYLWYTELTCIYLMNGLADIMGQVLGGVCVSLCVYV